MDANPNDHLRICIAIPTYARANQLDRLLTALADILMPDHCAIEAIVLDNATVPKMFDLVDLHATKFPFLLRYRHVPSPGLAAVRNEALAFCATREFDFLAMIDDDEIPTRGWLQALVRMARSTDADAVLGPVPSRLPVAAPTWLQKGRFFEPTRYRDGEEMRDGYSGNCLLRTITIERLRLRFDTAFNFAGGEDLVFFRDLLRGGGRLIYAEHAVADEVIEPDRCHAEYVVKLYFRRGNTLSLSDRRMGAGPLGFIVRLVKANARLVLGIVTFIPRSLRDGTTGTLQSVCDIALGLGALAGLAGFVYRPYRRASRSTSAS